jgi:hypothetical protein
MKLLKLEGILILYDLEKFAISVLKNIATAMPSVMERFIDAWTVLWNGLADGLWDLWNQLKNDINVMWSQIAVDFFKMMRSGAGELKVDWGLDAALGKIIRQVDVWRGAKGKDDAMLTETRKQTGLLENIRDNVGIMGE